MWCVSLACADGDGNSEEKMRLENEYLKESLNNEREERNYFQLERDKVRA